MTSSRIERIAEEYKNKYAITEYKIEHKDGYTINDKCAYIPKLKKEVHLEYLPTIDIMLEIRRQYGSEAKRIIMAVLEKDKNPDFYQTYLKEADIPIRELNESVQGLDPTTAELILKNSFVILFGSLKMNVAGLKNF